MQLLQHFKDLTVNPKNTKDLKGLILQLAIQGKLTANWRKDNPDVEPASELLKKIEKEKAQLIKEKKIRNEKDLIPITKDEIPFPLPKKWAWCRMLDFCYLITDGAHHTPKYVDDGIPFLSVKNLSKGFMDFSDTKFVEKETHAELIKRCNPEYNDILLTKIGTTGIAKVIDTKIDFSIFVSVALLKISKNNLYPYYIESCINSPFIKKQSSDGTEGVGNKNLVLRKIKNFLVPLPPFEEQQEIVRVVEILFKEVEQLEQLTKERIALKEDFVTSALRQLTTANTETEWNYLQNHFKSFFTEKSAVKKLREAVLQLAVQGKLTVDWRKSNLDTEPATELLKRIQKEKAQLIKDKKIKKESPLPPISDDEVPYELPESWVWCRVGDLTTIKGGKRIPKGYELSDEKTDHVYIRVTDMKNGTVISSKLKYITEDIFEIIKSYTISKDDLYITIAGTIGDVGEIPSELDNMNLTENAAKLIIYKIDKIFLKTLLRSNLCQSQFIGKVNQMAQPKLALHRVASTIIPLPPLEEQKAIVEKVNALMLLCDQLEQEVENSKYLNEQLMKSVLREVFESKNEKEHV
ncbi:MAG: restriction endonuclease subunit S [Kaistella sp.]